MAASFSRQHETEADSTGLQITALACYDTKRGANIFAKLAKFPGSRQATQWNDTHPASPERFVALQAASENINWRHHLHCYPLLRNLERIGIKLY
jgi:predicted Zn-dependent protease